MTHITHYGQYGPEVEMKGMDTGLFVKAWFSIWSPKTPESHIADVSLVGTHLHEHASAGVTLVNVTDGRYLYMGRFFTGNRPIVLPVRPFSRISSVLLHINVYRRDTNNTVLKRTIAMHSPNPDAGTISLGPVKMTRRAAQVIIKTINVKFPFSLKMDDAPAPKVRRVIEVVPMSEKTRTMISCSAMKKT